ncbi:GTP-binding protein [Paenibacillus uliginis N3/975]|uniref:Probable GTP-binding protein EngB n=1 Tax=Paenibacillus uliginis N3/975 TaxID=1313296 RepID=A0A1X7HM68_9BACL|nr:ribosome biogenesis GTP-binding protein YihA/YsxC [Paenibacillus uliginis]SMF89281.1 GTP-binding protein [Paenibacillus uliginis N3/975]
MKVTKSEFVISAVGPDQYPVDALPEIALAGRSNVGKSSLINRMLSRKNLARTSSTPGKTQQLNYYRANDDLYLVDFPGYGYAKVSKTQRAAFGEMIERYLLNREELKLVLLVVDLRHPPSKDDIIMYDWLQYYDRDVCVVATKADKIPRSRWSKHIKMVKETLGFRPHHSMVMFSSESGLGKDELWSIIQSYTNYGLEADEANEDDTFSIEKGQE